MEIKTERAENDSQSLTKFQLHNSIQKIPSAKRFKKITSQIYNDSNIPLGKGANIVITSHF